MYFCEDFLNVCRKGRYRYLLILKLSSYHVSKLCPLATSVTRYSARAEHISHQLEAAKEAIEQQIRRLTALRPAEVPHVELVEKMKAVGPTVERFRHTAEKTPREI